MCGIAGLAGGKPHATVTHNQGGDTVIGSRTAKRVPGSLTVHMGMNIHPAGGEELAFCIYFTPGSAVNCSQSGDTAVGYGQVSVKSGSSGAVDNVRVANDEVIHGCYLFGRLIYSHQDNASRCEIHYSRAAWGSGAAALGGWCNLLDQRPSEAGL